MGLVADIRARWTELDSPILRWSGEVLSRGQLLDRARAAAGLLAAHDVGAGDVVGLQADRGPDFLAMFLGALGRGATVLLLNGAYTAAEVRFLTGDAGAVFAGEIDVKCLLGHGAPELVDCRVNTRKGAGVYTPSARD